MQYTPGGRLNKKDGLTRYGDSLTWKSPYVDKTVFILRRGPSRWHFVALCCGFVQVGLTHMFLGHFAVAVVIAPVPVKQHCIICVYN